jgi:hypothetical protein
MALTISGTLERVAIAAVTGTTTLALAVALLAEKVLPVSCRTPMAIITRAANPTTMLMLRRKRKFLIDNEPSR